MERPLCVDCISDKSGLSADEVESYLSRVRRSVSVERGIALCRKCGNSTAVYSTLPAD
jgi:hypothetical protein